MPPRIDLSGKKFGRWSVVGAPESRDGRVYWDCLCDCGTRKSILGDNLRQGYTVSCGCYRDEKVSERQATHRCSHTKVHNTWLRIKDRCYNKSNRFYKDYGGRGISVCIRWLKSFEDFLADVGEPPSMTHSIERIKNDGNYEPGNVKWATKIEQSNNRRSNRMFTHNGETKSLAQWAQSLGINYSRLYARVVTQGMSFVEAITAPTIHQKDRNHRPKG